MTLVEGYLSLLQNSDMQEVFIGEGLGAENPTYH